MNKYFYNGKAIIASSKNDVIAFLSKKSSTITTASVSKDVVDWIYKTLAGVLDVYNIDADNEKKIFEKASNEISGILLEYFSWNDEKGELMNTAPFNPSICPKCTTFVEFRNKLHEKALEEVASIYEKATSEVVKIICNTLKSFGINENDANRLDLLDDVLERLVDNTYTEYNLEKYLNLKVTRSMYVPLQVPKVMLSIFRTQKLSEVVVRFINKQLPNDTIEALTQALYYESRNLDLNSFEKVLLCLNSIISRLSICVTKKYTINDLLSSSDSRDISAVQEFVISQNDKVYLTFSDAYGFMKPITILDSIRISPRVAEFRA